MYPAMPKLTLPRASSSSASVSRMLKFTAAPLSLPVFPPFPVEDIEQQGEWLLARTALIHE